MANYLLAGLDCAGSVHLVIGSNPLAAARCTQSLKAGARPVLVAPETADLHHSLRAQIDEGSVRWERKRFEDSDALRLGRDEVANVADAVFVTEGLQRDHEAISALCRRHRIPVNVVDAPHLCTFSLLSTHTDGPLQIGVTTNGRGCKLASRIRREIAASLPPNLGKACAQLGELRKRLQREDSKDSKDSTSSCAGELDDSVEQSALFNRLVTEDDARTRRIRWLSQICEYWPLKRLASIREADLQHLLQTFEAQTQVSEQALGENKKKQGTIILAGSGPGHPLLLTQATLRAIQTADVVLADKLVPSGVMDLIPRRTPVHIARKFPGNADRAQDELQVLALSAAQAGKTVLRLKQGDPFLYGRGGEEVLFFRARDAGVKVLVLPGLTSALAAPLFAGVPVTQRDVADQVLLCTGTGRAGHAPRPPGYVPSRTVVFLMALHRIGALVGELTAYCDSEEEEGKGDEKRQRTLFPLDTPCAVVERASCPDQRIIRTSLRHVAQAIEAEGSRPPGLLVVGKACHVLYDNPEDKAWHVEDGFRALDDLGGDLILGGEQNS